MATSRVSRVRPLQLALAVLLFYWVAAFSIALFSVAAPSADPQQQIRDASVNLRARNGPDTVARERCAQHTRDGDASSSLIDYERLVYCTRLGDSLPLARTVLVLMLVVLLYLLSSTADSFFCPVLQAIVEKYRIPPDIAGVTFLSFGNGSPDVFSNIAAFSTATPKIGVASILGGGLLVTTVIAASVGMASQDQDQLIPRKFVRDVVFYFIAVSYLCFVFFIHTVGLAEALGFLLIYACYVGVILFDKRLARVYYYLTDRDPDDVDEFDTTRHLLTQQYWSSSDKSASDSDERLATPTTQMIMDFEVFRIPTYTSASDSEQSDTSITFPVPTKLYRKSSVPTPRSIYVDDQFSYDESLPLVWRTPAARPASVCVPTLARPKRLRNRTAWESTQLTAHSNLTAKRWTRWYHELNDIAEVSGVSDTEIDDEDGGRETDALSPRALPATDSIGERYLFRWFRASYYLFERFVWSPLEFGTTFIRRLTIPLLDDETWDKTFAIACPPCAILLAGVSVFGLNPFAHVYFAAAIVVGGGAGSVAVYLTASPLTPPEGTALAPYICLAFVMSVIWIMSIANEVLSLLEVLGGLFGLSNSVLGVSVLAWGNSIGDLVSNTSIARDGFPTMAFAGCFAGPMFNLLVGIGMALTIAIASRGPISMGKPSPLVYLGFGFLFASLILNLSFAAFDGFRYRPRMCYALLILYASFVALSIAVVALDEKP